MASTATQHLQRPVLLVVGAGSGIGMHVARRFVQGGYHACLVRRSPPEANDLLPHTTHFGGVDITQPDALEHVVEEVERDVGPIQCAVYNIGAQMGHRDLTNTSLRQFELAWQLGTNGLFRLARTLLPKMAERRNHSNNNGDDDASPGASEPNTDTDDSHTNSLHSHSPSLLVTSSTAAVRGNPGQHAHASAMGGRRMLCQSLRAEFATASNNIHIAHLILDGAVDAPDTLGKLVGQEVLERLRMEQRLMKPAAIAETYWHVAHQDPTVQSFEVDLRSQTDVPWWNSPPPKL